MHSMLMLCSFKSSAMHILPILATCWLSCVPIQTPCRVWYCLLQLFEYILEYLRTVRFGEPDNSLAMPADQTELAQIVREVNTLVSTQLVKTWPCAKGPPCLCVELPCGLYLEMQI